MPYQREVEPDVLRALREDPKIRAGALGVVRDMRTVCLSRSTAIAVAEEWTKLQLEQPCQR